MRIFNADGSEVGACGNVTRCVAVMLAEETALGLCDRDSLRRAGPRRSGQTPRASTWARRGSSWADIPLAHPVDDTNEVFIGPAGAGAAER